MSAILNLKRAAERLLKTNFPTTEIAYENVSFDKTAGTYFRTMWQINPPDDPVIGDKYYRERAMFSVFVCTELNKGTAEAIGLAEQIRTLFSKGTTMNELGTNIYVLTTPQIAGSMATTEKLVVPVMISLVAEVYS